MSIFFINGIEAAMELRSSKSNVIRILFFAIFTLLFTACSKDTVPEKIEVSVNAFSSNNSVPSYSCTKVLGSVQDIKDALSTSMNSGSTICIAPGVYEDLSLNFGGKGTAGKPIVVTSQVPGSVIFSGVSRVRMTGSFVTLQGIIFQNGSSGPSAFILLRRGDIECNHCRVTENTIVDWDLDNNERNHWISISGQYNRVDHNWISGKRNRGSMVYIARKYGEPDYATIDHNYFGDRSPFGGKAYPDMKDGDLEVIRLGSSIHHESSSFSRVEHNLFENIRAETEIVSIKSSYNTIHGNTFRGSYGSLSNRHGSNNVYSNNFILGDGYPFAGGIRVADAGHVIINNYIDSVSYPGSVHHGAIVLMAADDPKKYEVGFSGYKQVENVLVAHNTIVNSVSSFLMNGGRKTFAPRNITLLNNVVSKAVGPVITHVDKGFPKSSSVANNYVMGSELTDSASDKKIDGFIYGSPMFDHSAVLARPAAKSVVIGGAVKLPPHSAGHGQSIEALYHDMDGHPRTSFPDSGADQVSTEAAVLFPLTKDMVGPKSYSALDL